MANALIRETNPMPANSMGSSQAKPAPRWAIHRRMYDWVLSLAHKKYAVPALFAIAFAESSFFPIPPDVLQIALTLERRERAWLYAFVSLCGSVIGALFGFLIGWALWNGTQDFFFTYIFSQHQFEYVQQLYHQWDFWIVFAAAFTPIPYKVITIAAGVFGVGHDAPLFFLAMFIVASIVGRGARFFLVGGLLWWLGPAVKNFIDRYFNWVCIAFTVLLIGGFLLIKVMASH